MNYNMYPHGFLDSLMLERHRELYSKIELLDWEERTIGEIQGKITDGSVSIDGNSAIRRTCSLSMIVDDTNYDITSVKNEISINKKAKIFVGMVNNTKHQEYGKIIWFPLGVFVLTESSISHNITSSAISITAQDKMCLLSGEVSGKLQSPIELHRETFFNVETGKYENRDILIYEIIKYVVTGLGGELPGKVLINDVPLEIKQAMRYIGKETKYFDRNNNELLDVTNPDTDNRVQRILNSGDYAGFILNPFTFPNELIKQPGDSITSILDDIKGALGNYEYFYDIEGNFVFQEVKNYMNTTFTPLTQLSDGKYMADFSKVPYIYSFKEKDIVQSFNNTPDWKNIKNDFVVWGMRQNGTGTDGAPIMYHLAIDNKPYLPPAYNKPWQQYLVEYGDNNIASPGRYYQELKGKLPQVYNSETNKWNSDPANYNYYFDLISAQSELGKFSVSTIGRRTQAISDNNVTMLYPPEIPDIIVLPVGADMSEINNLIALGLKFQIVPVPEYETVYEPGNVGKDAFTVIRELLYIHTTFNEVITMQSLPIYFLEANNRIEVEDKRSNIYGDYIIKSMSIPLSPEGLMAINAIRVSNRI